MTRKEAKAAGLKRYVTGKPCALGNVFERLTSNGKCMCQPCQKAVRAKLDPEKRSARMRRWREANMDQRAAYRVEYRAKNTEKTKADNDRFREANREKRAAQTADYRRANPGQNRAAVARWRAAVLKATPWWADEDAILAVYEEAARLTDEQGRVYHVDHIVPLRGENVCGLHIAWNLRPLPASENCRKSNRFDEAVCSL